MVGVNNPFYVVASGSMIPRLNVGDLGIVKHATDDRDDSSFSNLQIGDIIQFNTPYKTTEGKHKVIVHRVAEIVTDAEGEKIVRKRRCQCGFNSQTRLPDNRKRLHR